MENLKITNKQPKNENLVYGKIQPQALDIEKNVLGAILTDYSALIRALPIITLEDFYLPKNSLIFNSILILFSNGKGVDFLTVCEQLRKDGSMDAVGGSYEVVKLSEDAFGSANIEEWCRILVEKRIKRQLIQLGQKVVSDGFDDTVDAFDLQSKTESGVSAILENATSERIKSIAQESAELVNEILENRINPKGFIGLRTGFKTWDENFTGLDKGNLIILGAGTGEGKSTMALQIAYSVAQNENVLFFSLEMSEKQLLLKIISSLTNIEAKRLQLGQITEAEEKKVIYANKLIFDSKLMLKVKGGISVDEIKNTARSFNAKNKLGLIVVDYLQLITTGKKFGTRSIEIDEITNSLKSLGMELNIPVVALSQVSRGDKNSKPRPYVLSDLRESGGIENTANEVYFIWRPSKHNLEQINFEGVEYVLENENKGLSVLICAKSRMDTVGAKLIKSKLQFNRFEDFNNENNSFKVPQKDFF